MYKSVMKSKNYYPHSIVAVAFGNAWKCFPKEISCRIIVQINLIVVEFQKFKTAFVLLRLDFNIRDTVKIRT